MLWAFFWLKCYDVVEAGVLTDKIRTGYGLSWHGGPGNCYFDAKTLFWTRGKEFQAMQNQAKAALINRANTKRSPLLKRGLLTGRKRHRRSIDDDELLDDS